MARQIAQGRRLDLGHKVGVLVDGDLPAQFQPLLPRAADADLGKAVPHVVAAIDGQPALGQPVEFGLFRISAKTTSGSGEPLTALTQIDSCPTKRSAPRRCAS